MRDWEAHVFDASSGETLVFVVRPGGPGQTQYVTGIDEWGNLVVQTREHDPTSPPDTDEDLSFFRLSMMVRPDWQGFLPALAAGINRHDPPSEAAELAAAEARITVLNSALDRERTRVDHALNALLTSHIERTTP